PIIVPMPKPDIPRNKARLRSYPEATTDGSPVCIICGGTSFGPGPSGRKSRSGLWPQCLGCHSLERHRLLRKIWLSFPETFLSSGNVLQFSPDLCVLPEWFKNHELSIYGGDNTIDMENISRPDS